MPEYMKLEAIMEYCQNQKDKTISCNDLARFNTTDVIERSEIDKAIVKIEFLRQYRAENINSKICIDSEEVLKILKNIGE